jgi:oligopeptide transport system substrate-binding protein
MRLPVLCVAALAAAMSPGLQAGQLNRGTAAEPGTLDPHIATGNSAAPVLYDMNVGLTTFDNDGRVTAGAAESWTISDDGLTYTFTLRPDLKWSDGSPLSAEDFVYSFRRLLMPATAARFASFFYAIRNARAVVKGELPPGELGVSAPDAQTVVIELEFPAAYFLQNLGSNPGAPVPRQAIQEHGRRWTRPGNMLSNGAYRLVQYVPQSHIELEKNPHFYAADSVQIDKVRYYPTQNLATQLNRYLAGELDVLLAFPVDKVASLREERPDELLIWPSLGTSYFVLNTREKPFDDPRVRRALSLAIDRDGLVAKILSPGETAAYTLTPVAISNHEPPVPDWAAQPMGARMAEARRLMSAAGYGPGNPLKLTVRYDTREETRRLVVAVSAMWRGIGVQATAEDSDFITLNKSARTADFQVLRYAWFAPNDDPGTFLGLLDSNNPNNYSGYANPEFDRQYRAANARLDTAARMQGLIDAEVIALNEDPVIPVSFFGRRFLVKPYVKGFRKNPRGLTQTRYVTIEK